LQASNRIQIISESTESGQNNCNCVSTADLRQTSLKKVRLLERKITFLPMTEKTDPKKDISQAPLNTEKIPEDLSVEMRRIAHDLSNALEIIIQTSYLLNTVELKEPASDWLRMLDSGVQKAMSYNLELRNYIKDHTAG
jgi:hypothetical protein